MSYRGHVERGVVLLDEPARLPDGTNVSVRPLKSTRRPRRHRAGARSARPKDSPAQRTSKRLAQPLADFWTAPTISELARRQRVLLPGSIEALAGSWPRKDSLDEFLDAVRRGRE